MHETWHTCGKQLLLLYTSVVGSSVAYVHDRLNIDKK